LAILAHWREAPQNYDGRVFCWREHLDANMQKPQRDSGPNMPEQQCPYCQWTLNTSWTPDTPESELPKEHDGSVCINCAEILIFDQDLRLRKPYGGEIERIMGVDPEYIKQLQALQARIKAVNAAE
jgi:hypothetical protein